MCILVKRRNVMLLHDNTKPPSARMTQEKILNLDWSVLPHPSYLLDIAPSDFHFFYSLQNVLNDKRFSQEDQVKRFVENFLSSKPAEFYLIGINKLPEW